MRRTIAIAAVVLVAAGVLTYLQWHLRAARAARTIAPASDASLEFKTLLGEGHWVPIAPEDATGMVAAFNADRRRLAEATTPVFAPRGGLSLASAPSYVLRHDEQIEEWVPFTTINPLISKYSALSLRAEVASDEPTISAKQIKQPSGGDIEIIVTDSNAKTATIVAFARTSFYDVKLKTYRYGDGMPITLNAEGPAGHFRGTFAVGEVVHQGTLAIEYTYNDLPQSHNDYTRMVSCQVTMLFH